MSKIASIELIAARILFIRGRKVMLDRDLAALYGVSTKVLNQAVKRNIERFPEDFMFRLTQQEKSELVTNCDQFKLLKHSVVLPYAFTEQGVAMLSSVLNSQIAVKVNIQIMRAFVRLKEALVSYDKLAVKINELEEKYIGHDEKLRDIFEAIRQLVICPPEEKRRIKGFSRD